MKSWILSVVLLVSGSVVADARLEDSRLDLTQRFGQPNRELSDQFAGSREYRFSHEGWTIRAWLQNGRCHRIDYSRLGNGALTEAQVKALMKSNSAELVWHRDRSSDNLSTLILSSLALHHYARSDKKAFCSKGAHTVSFKSAHWVSLEEQARTGRAEESSTVPNF